MTYRIPYGDTHLTFDLPWTHVDVATRPAQPLRPLSADEIQQRLSVFAQDIAATAQQDDTEVVIVFTDATRAAPDGVLAAPLLRAFQAHGVMVSLLCAVGMHRPSTEQEKREKLGDWIMDNFTVLDHDPAQVVEVGMIDGVPLEINPALLNKVVIGLGVVEPHQYAGYSGGYKTCVIGCGGAETIATTHGPRFLQHHGTRLANVENNPFQDFVRRAGDSLPGTHYAVNVIVDDDAQILALATGTPPQVHDNLISRGRPYFEVPVPHEPYDVVIAGVGAPKDANLYQASRGATYIGLSAAPVVRDGGVIVLPARLAEGAGAGRSELNMFEVLQQFGPTPDLRQHLLENGCRPGEQRAFMIAQLLQRYRLIIVSAERQAATVVQAAGLEFAPSMEATIDLIALENPRTLIVPHAIKMIPVAIGST